MKLILETLDFDAALATVADLAQRYRLLAHTNEGEGPHRPYATTAGEQRSICRVVG